VPLPPGDGRFDALRADDLAPCIEARLERHRTRLREGYLDRFQYFFLRHAEIEGDADVALDVPLARAHDGQADDEDQFLRPAVEASLREVRGVHQFVRGLDEVKILLHGYFVVIEDVAALGGHHVDVRLLFLLSRHASSFPSCHSLAAYNTVIARRRCWLMQRRAKREASTLQRHPSCVRACSRCIPHASS